MAELVLLRGARKGERRLRLAPQRLRHRALVAALLLAATARCTEPQAPSQRAGAGHERCARDADCRSGFCDAERCADPEGAYGRACVPAPRTAEGLRDGMLHTCGAYLCVDARCRSCRSDEECLSELGAPRCEESEGRPGRRCGA